MRFLRGLAAAEAATVVMAFVGFMVMAGAVPSTTGASTTGGEVANGITTPSVGPCQLVYGFELAPENCVFSANAIPPTADSVSCVDWMNGHPYPLKMTDLADDEKMSSSLWMVTNCFIVPDYNPETISDAVVLNPGDASNGHEGTSSAPTTLQKVAMPFLQTAVNKEYAATTTLAPAGNNVLPCDIIFGLEIAKDCSITISPGVPTATQPKRAVTMTTPPLQGVTALPCNIVFGLENATSGCFIDLPTATASVAATQNVAFNPRSTGAPGVIPCDLVYGEEFAGKDCALRVY